MELRFRRDSQDHAPQLGRAAERLTAESTAEAERVRRDAAASFDQDMRQALARTVWQSGCTSWYVDEHGNNPNQWPWLWTTYRRRTARLDPAAYQLG